ncbi:hypothetical protein L211DRAFT_854207 [Terfezia boudieri ATCC MYA-4762]|uniref:Uncharacterized protein n=1 Tax=Terfezia boudieri ATCC MYA-4762 TaxID=1051890 RepID=A0A3N4LA48_9PEZI|nr:hypothetical protein L211DRAFT_854207 [Terfezia boudieri ATCC MYA-4762]
MHSEDWAVGPQIVYISPQSYSSQSDSPRDTQKGDEDTPQAASINPQYLFTLSSSLDHSPKHTLEDDENTTQAATFPGDPPKDTGIIINPQRKARKERAKKKSYPCGFLGKRCEFMLNKSGFKDCAKLKEDALRHINGYQCLTCGARFGKPYGLKRHHLNKTKCTKRDCELVHPALLLWMRKLEKAQGYSLIKSAINHCKPYCDMNTNSQSQHKARKNKFNGTTNTQHEAPLVPNPLAIPDISPIDSDASGESHPDNDIPDNYMTSGSLLVQPEERLVHVNDGGFALAQQRGSQGLASNVLGQDNSDVDMSYGGYPEKVADTQDHFSLSPARPTTPITPFINYEDFNHGQGYSHAPAIADPQGPFIYLHTGTSDNAAAYSAATTSTPPQDLQGHNSAQHQDPLYSTINYPLVYPSDSLSTDYNQLLIRIANDDLQLGDASETLADPFWPTGFTG